MAHIFKFISNCQKAFRSELRQLSFELYSPGVNRRHLSGLVTVWWLLLLPRLDFPDNQHNRTTLLPYISLRRFSRSQPAYPKLPFWFCIHIRSHRSIMFGSLSYLCTENTCQILSCLFILFMMTSGKISIWVASNLFLLFLL